MRPFVNSKTSTARPFLPVAVSEGRSDDAARPTWFRPDGQGRLRQTPIRAQPSPRSRAATVTGCHVQETIRFPRVYPLERWILGPGSRRALQTS
jgi:hypothetical protein